MRLLLVSIALAGLSSPAFATEWTSCNDADGAASFDYLAGDGLGVLSISALTISAGELVWATDPANGPGDPVQVGQQFEDADSIRIDAMDDKFMDKIAELRLFKASEGGDFIAAGTLKIAGMGVWAVSCGAR